MPYTGCGLNHSTSTWRGPGRLAKRHTLNTSDSRNQPPKNSVNPTTIRYGVGLRSHLENRYTNISHAPISPPEDSSLPLAIARVLRGSLATLRHHLRHEAGSWILPPGYCDGSWASIFASGTLSPRSLRISSVQLESTRSAGSSAIGSTLISWRNAVSSFIILRTSSLMP